MEPRDFHLFIQIYLFISKANSDHELEPNILDRFRPRKKKKKKLLKFTLDIITQGRRKCEDWNNTSHPSSNFDQVLISAELVTQSSKPFSSGIGQWVEDVTSSYSIIMGDALRF